MKNRKRILVCPLDWGLGHATRCIPLIHALLNEGAEVIIAADGGPLALLKEEFPRLTFIRLPGYHIHYSKRLSMIASILIQLPKIIFNISLEHRRLKKIISDHKIDCVISDNRYGLWNRSIRTVFISHQLSIRCPVGLKLLEPLIYRLNRFFINKYDECWVPDVDGENNLSGDLSHNIPLPKHGVYIGLLSRFDSIIEIAPQRKYDLMAIVSGPEPHRSVMLDIILYQFKEINLSSLIVSGEPMKKYDRKINKNIRMASHLEADAMKEAIIQSEVIICRAGYSGIMDLVSLKKNAILIPTPGQTEQEYLAAYLRQKKVFYTVSQKEFKITDALSETNHFGDFSNISTEKKYIEVLKRLMEKIREAY